MAICAYRGSACAKTHPPAYFTPRQTLGHDLASHQKHWPYQQRTKQIRYARLEELSRNLSDSRSGFACDYTSALNRGLYSIGIRELDFWYSTVPQSKMVVKLQAAEMSRSRESLKACLTTARRCGTSVNIVLAYAREFRLWTAHTPKAVPKR